jgi:phosphoenolpyruvate carboxykinase (GTP)
LFQTVLNKDYPKEDYEKQFTVRVAENLAKLERVEEFYGTKVNDTPQIVFKVFEEQRQRLIKAREEYGDYIVPAKFE